MLMHQRSKRVTLSLHLRKEKIYFLSQIPPVDTLSSQQIQVSEGEEEGKGNGRAWAPSNEGIPAAPIMLTWMPAAHFVFSLPKCLSPSWELDNAGGKRCLLEEVLH